MLLDSHCSVPKIETDRSELYSGLTIGNCISYVVKKLYLDKTIEESLHGIIEELLKRIELFPEYAEVSERTSVFLFSFIILDGAWVISAVALLSEYNYIYYKLYVIILFCFQWAHVFKLNNHQLYFSIHHGL